MARAELKEKLDSVEEKVRTCSRRFCSTASFTGIALLAGVRSRCREWPLCQIVTWPVLSHQLPEPA